eukprot:s872_g14.t1
MGKTDLVVMQSPDECPPGRLRELWEGQGKVLTSADISFSYCSEGGGGSVSYTYLEARETNGNQFASINRPTAGARYEAKLERGREPLQCNKCKIGTPSQGDTWCVGCSGLESLQELLKQRWQQPGVRQIAEETILNAARLVRAFGKVDRGLGESTAGQRDRAERRSLPPPPPAPERASSHRGRSRSPRRDDRPPLRRSDHPGRPESKHRAEPPAARDQEEESFDEEEEEEEETGGDTRGDPPVRVKEEDRHRPPPEPKHPPRRDRSRKKKRRKRGGRKHQQHRREYNQPLRLSHRRLKASTLSLATSAREGFERRI